MAGIEAPYPRSKPNEARCRFSEIAGSRYFFAAFRHHIESNGQFGLNIDKLFVVESIPRNELGKIQQALLKGLLQEIGEQSDSPA